MTDTHPPYTQAPSLARIPAIHHGFFGSRGGVSTGIYASLNAGAGSADAPGPVATNRARIAAAIGAPSPAHLLSCHQYHSTDVAHAAAPFEDNPKADAMVTDTPGLALAILTADCTPVLFADPEAGIIGAAHSGWKGALGGIAEATIEAMETLGARASRITAAIGPCIAQASYEVGPEFRDSFLTDTSASDRFFIAGKGDRMHFDLPSFIQARLTAAGLSDIETIAHDTCALADQYFSNRRRNHQGLPDYGRNASVIMLKP